MKGFKPTGYGPTAGFQFPASFGFTGSTGAYTNVSPYVRQKPAPRAFAAGGYVSEKVGDQGHALVQRSRPYTNEDQESGGKTPLRRGFKDGGKIPGPPRGKRNPNPMKTSKAPSDAMKRARKMHKADGGPVSARADFDDLASRVDSETSENARDQAEAQAQRAFMRSKKADESWRHKAHGPKSGGPLSQAMGMKGKFAAADGGRIYGSSSKGFASDVAKTGEFIGQIPRMIGDALKSKMRSTQDDVAYDKRRRIDSIADGTNTASNYARGGKAKSAKMKRMGYAKGGGVTAGEAKKIAQVTVGEHVGYPAPKGHKGLGAMCKS